MEKLVVQGFQNANFLLYQNVMSKLDIETKFLQALMLLYY